MEKNKSITVKVSEDTYREFQVKAESLGLSTGSFLRMLGKRFRIDEVPSSAKMSGTPAAPRSEPEGQLDQL